jgi:hypothetical protein
VKINNGCNGVVQDCDIDAKSPHTKYIINGCSTAITDVNNLLINSKCVVKIDISSII